MEKCSKCGSMISDNDIMAWKCAKCGKAFRVNLSKLKKVQMQKDKPENAGKTLLKCPTCGNGIDDGNERIACKCSACGNVMVGNLRKFVGEDKENHVTENQMIASSSTHPYIPNNFIKCSNCGNSVVSNMKFCPECGHPTSSFYRKRNMKPFIVFGSIIIVFLVLFSAKHMKNIALTPKQSSDKNVSLENEGENNSKETSHNTEKTPQNTMDSSDADMNNIFNQFLNNEIPYDKAVALLDPFLNDSASKANATSISKDIDKIYKARETIMQAKQYEDNGELERAITEYAKVIYSEIKDEKTISDAQTKLESLKQTFIKNSIKKAKKYARKYNYNQAIKIIEKAESVCGTNETLVNLRIKYTEQKNNEYPSIEVINKTTQPRYTDEFQFSDFVIITIRIKNNSKKPIQGIEYTISVSDLFGNGIINLEADSLGHTIQPEETYEDQKYYEINPFNNEEVTLYGTKYKDLIFNYTISTIVYEDGTTERISI